MAKIKVRIDKKTGTPTIMGVCGAGKNCLEATREYEKNLGMAKENTRVMTEEYFEELDPQILVNEKDSD